MQRYIKQQRYRFLQRLQAVTRTDVRYLLRGGFWVSLAKAINIIGGIVLTIALANALDKQTLGIYQFVLSMAAVLSAFTLTGLSLTITKATAQGEDGSLRSGIRTKLKWNIGIVLASATVAGYYFYNDNQLLGQAFLVVGALSPFIEAFQLHQSYLVGKEAFRLRTAFVFTRKLIPVVSLLLALLYTQDPLHLVTVYFVSNLLAVFLNHGLTLHLFKPGFAPDFSQAVRYSKHLSVMALASRLANHADKILIFHLLGAPAAAIFTIAQLPAKQLDNSVNLLQPLVLPRLAKRDLATLQQTLTRKILIVVGLVSIVFGLYVLTAPWIYDVAFPEYTDAVLYSQVLAISVLFVSRGVFTNALLAHEKTKALYVIQIGLPLLKIILLYVCITVAGIWGAIAAILFEKVLGTVVVYGFFRYTPTVASGKDLGQ